MNVSTVRNKRSPLTNCLASKLRILERRSRPSARDDSSALAVAELDEAYELAELDAMQELDELEEPPEARQFFTIVSFRRISISRRPRASGTNASNSRPVDCDSYKASGSISTAPRFEARTESAPEGLPLKLYIKTSSHKNMWRQAQKGDQININPRQNPREP
jgi:hypothetical protein